MRVIREVIVSGEACGKQRFRVENDNNELLGWIQCVFVDWSPILGGGDRFIAQQCHNNNYGMQIFGCLWEAFQFLGITNIQELDECNLPDGIYQEYARPFRYGY